MDIGTTAVVVSLVAVVVLVGLMALGWRNRTRRQQHFQVPPTAPGGTDRGEPLYSAEGQYVVTTTSGDWLDRVNAHGLGNKAEATVAVYPHGVLFDRSGDTEVYVPREALASARLERGMAGKFVEKDGLVVIGWTLGTETLDTGFRTRYAADKPQLLKAVSALIDSPDPAHNPPGKESQ